MLEFLAGALLIAAAIWALRRNSPRPDMRQLDRALGGVPAPRKPPAAPELPSLAGVRDVRLAAAILMVQLVRTGNVVTEQERSCILGFLQEPLRAPDPAALYKQALQLTVPRLPLRVGADALLPLLRRKLDLEERMEFVEMLDAVANAYVEASDLQIEEIAQLKARLA